MKKYRFRYLLLILLVFLALPSTAQAYIGPGAGMAIMGSFWVMFMALLSALLALLTWPIRFLIRSIKGRKAFARSKVKKVVILGLDGMDHGLAEKMLNEGKLPNFAKLRDQGCFKPLQTTIPSISPVAWSSFQTGCNPGKHNIFDFLTRDKKTYCPKLSSVEIRGASKNISLGKYNIPFGKADIRLQRKSKPFWKTLGENGIFSNVLRVPITFPPEKFYGVSLSGMCVPDLRGSQGMFSYYTTQNKDSQRTGGEHFHVTRTGNKIHADLIGPDNPFLKETKPLTIPFTVSIVDNEKAELIIAGQKYTLTKDVYTEWITVEFKAVGIVKISGICKFLLLSVEPDFELYVTPINIDPAKPAMPISHPSVYSTYLAKSQGPFATLGLAEDSWALNEKVLVDESFIQQCEISDLEREQMFFDSLDKVGRGLCVCVFDGTDRLQHTFWRDIDQAHPIHKGKQTSDRNVIEELYQRMDLLVARTVEKCKDKDTLLMIISDHGFATFRYGVDLNRWLEENGYLKIKEGTRGDKYLTGIDWANTKAYAVGLTGLFINLKGRESQGIVDSGSEADKLRDEIAGKLSALKDPATDQPAIKNVYNALKTYKGPYKTESPDLIVGYHKGYRASWETAVGQVTEQIFHENLKAWSGDHCIDPTLVPGVLFCNRPVDNERTRLMDIGPTVLDMFGVDVPAYMDGIALKVASKGPNGKIPETEKEK